MRGCGPAGWSRTWHAPCEGPSARWTPCGRCDTPKRPWQMYAICRPAPHAATALPGPRSHTPSASADKPCTRPTSVTGGTSSSATTPACGACRCPGGGGGSDGGCAGARRSQQWSRSPRGSPMAGAGGLAASGAHSRARCAPPRASGPLQPPERGHPPPPAARAVQVVNPRTRQPRRAGATGRADDNIGGGFPPLRRSATPIFGQTSRRPSAHHAQPTLALFTDEQVDSQRASARRGPSPASSHH